MLDKVPAELKTYRNWVLWKTVVRDGLPTKLPFQANGAPAKSNDPKTWTSFETACEAFSRGEYSGLGFVFSESDGFCGIDLDGCRCKDTGAYAEWAKAILARVNSYSEVSPSSTGVKIFVRGESPWGAGKRFAVQDAEQFGDKEPAIEVYDKGRYFAVTGFRIANLSQTVEERQDALNWLAETYGPKPRVVQCVPFNAPACNDQSVITRARAYLAKVPVSISGQGGHNAAMHAACVLVIGFGLSESDAMPLMREWNVGCQPPWSEHDLLRKLSEATKRPGERNTLRNVNRDFPRAKAGSAGSGEISDMAQRICDIREMARGLDGRALMMAIHGLLNELELQNLGSK